VDIEAEMQKLQAEARAKLAEDAAPEPELPPTPIPERLKAKSQALASDIEEKVKADVFTPGVLLEATKLAEKATEGSSLSLGTKIGLGVGGLLIFLVTWEFILAPILMALISVAFLALIIAGILKLVGFFDKDDEDSDEDSGDEA
jgi:hypothetical protein